MSLVSAWCKGCAYYGWIGTERCCNYLLANKQCRPCPAGDGCTEHTKKRKDRKMAQEKRWNMETAARLLQYGATGKAVAEAVGCTPSEISKNKDTLMSMVVEPLTQNEADKLLRKKEPFKLSPPEEKTEAPKEERPQASFKTAVASCEPIVNALSLDMKRLQKPEIMVSIDIGKGRVRLEAENAQVLETLINMLVAMGGRE